MTDAATNYLVYFPYRGDLIPVVTHYSESWQLLASFRLSAILYLVVAFKTVVEVGFF